jgi:hypothetical protein
MTELPAIENAEVLTSIFGYWPSFHDAEVLTMHLDRDGEDGPILEADIHVYHATDRVDERGFYVLTKHTRVTFRFTNVLLRDLRYFNHQNSLSGLGFYHVDPTSNDGRAIGASFGANYGVQADLLCSRAIVKSAEPFQRAV